jgi:glutamate:GABA antiporter
MTTTKKTLGLYTLITISIVAVFNPRTLPIMASNGLVSIGFFFLAGILYFIPSALICAELSTTWPETGGVYIWIRRACGKKAGFIAIWFEWLSNVVGWPASLAFIAATLAYVISPALAQNKLFTIAIILIFFWGFTVLNYFGIKISSQVSSVCFLVGTALPTLLIIALGIRWVWHGNPMQIAFHWKALFPTPHFSSFALFIGVMLGYAGIYITAFHGGDVIQPKKNFPRAIAIASLFIFVFLVLGTLAIAIVIPRHTLSMVAGTMQALTIFFAGFHLHWLLPLLAIIIAIGASAMLNTWIAGPTKGLLASARNGDLPALFARTNKHGAPTPILTAQAIIVSLFALFYLFTPGINLAYWIITAASGIAALLMNLLLFASVIVLRYKEPDQARPYAIPGGLVGVWIVGGTGFVMGCLGIVLGFIPPNLLHVTGRFYDSWLLVILLVLSVPAFFLHRAASRSKKALPQE